MDHKLEEAFEELNSLMKLFALQEEFEYAIKIQKIKTILNRPREKSFGYSKIRELRSEIYKIVGDGEVIELFDSILEI